MRESGMEDSYITSQKAQLSSGFAIGYLWPQTSNFITLVLVNLALKQVANLDGFQFKICLVEEAFYKSRDPF